MALSIAGAIAMAAIMLAMFCVGNRLETITSRGKPIARSVP